MITYLKTLFKRRRIVEVNDVFIAQILVIRFGIFSDQSHFFGWAGINRNGLQLIEEWSRQRDYCGVREMPAASKLIYDYLDWKQEEKSRKKRVNKKIIHDLEPKIWTILKTEGRDK